MKDMNWIKGRPGEDGRYLVCEIRKYKNNRWLEIKILTWNSHYTCWDDEGDDNYCDPENVYCWMPLPDLPNFE